MSMPRVSLARYFWGAEADGALAIQTWSGEARYINEPWSINAHRHMDADPPHTTRTRPLLKRTGLRVLEKTEMPRQRRWEQRANVILGSKLRLCINERSGGLRAMTLRS